MCASVAIHWFRRGLRLHDNPALLHALKTVEAPQGKKARQLLPLFVLDPDVLRLNPKHMSVNRLAFLLETLRALDTDLRTLGSKLHICIGNTSTGKKVGSMSAHCLLTILSDLAASETNVLLTYEQETDPLAAKRDSEVLAMIQELNGKTGKATGQVLVHSTSTQTLYNMARLFDMCPGGTAPLTMQSFRNLLRSVPTPAQPLAAPAEVFPAAPTIVSCNVVRLTSANKGKKDDQRSRSRSPKRGGAPVTFLDEIPSLEDLIVFLKSQQQQNDFFSSIDYEPYSHRQLTSHLPKAIAGEKNGLRCMANFFQDEVKTREFEKPNTSPTALVPETTLLSPHLQWGSLSPRRFYHELMKVYKKGKHSQPPVSLEGQLLWREFYYFVAYAYHGETRSGQTDGSANPRYDVMKGNSICKQIPWEWSKEKSAQLRRWENGQTGFPAVDAAMNQLRQEGWMHHLARHLCACFLTRGDLFISWEHGRDVFEKYLLDHDWALNNGNWMWLSASCFFYQFFRCYSPISFFKKSNDACAYIRKYVPQLASYPDKYLFEPWLASKKDQEKWGCVVGVHYPVRMVDDHTATSKENMAKMGAAYDAAKAAKSAKRSRSV